MSFPLDISRQIHHWQDKIHFEDLWEEAEGLSELSDLDPFEIESHVDLLYSEPERKEYHMGKILFELCGISKELNINTFVALQKEIADRKSEMLEKK